MGGWDCWSKYRAGLEFGVVRYIRLMSRVYIQLNYLYSVSPLSYLHVALDFAMKPVLASCLSLLLLAFVSVLRHTST